VTRKEDDEFPLIILRGFKMGAHSFEDIDRHYGHELAVVLYGKDHPDNAAIECIDCAEVLLDFDREPEEQDDE
jgi:hypothetical protein